MANEECKKNLIDFFGILSKEGADELERNIRESRKIHRALTKKRDKRLEKLLNS